ncbi:hypothetical protein ABZT04_26455 [Streptomyces sp. NPDC005492]|uniref:hypothetical protein n=1 Tax=Streptomyces sp. NPDC005492 TaxID=3156883 RepID=UPI0033ADC913
MRLHRSRWCAVLAFCLAGCGTAVGGTRVEGRAPTGIPWSGPVYVEDWRSQPRREPDMMDLTEVTTLDRLKWRDWGRPRATATGVVIDLACLSLCEKGEPPTYRVRVVLNGLSKRQYAAYYGHASVTALASPAPWWAEGVGSVRLHVPKA